MKIIVDTSALIAVIANEPTKNSIIEATRGAELIAPPSVHWEIGNAFSSMLRCKLITTDQALKCLKVYEQISLHFEDVELDASLQLAAEQNDSPLNVKGLDLNLGIDAILQCIEEGRRDF